MCTELVVASFSVSSLAYCSLNSFLTPIHQIWIGFAWGIVYCMIERVDIFFFRVQFVTSYVCFFTRSISAVFQDLHHFNIAETGTVFIAMV